MLLKKYKITVYKITLKRDKLNAEIKRRSLCRSCDYLNLNVSEFKCELFTFTNISSLSVCRKEINLTTSLHPNYFYHPK